MLSKWDLRCKFGATELLTPSTIYASKTPFWSALLFALGYESLFFSLVIVPAILKSLILSVAFPEKTFAYSQTLL